MRIHKKLLSTETEIDITVEEIKQLMDLDATLLNNTKYSSSIGIVRFLQNINN